MLSAVFADGSVDPLTGGSGWLGAGMLGLVIFWLLYKHIPNLMTSHLDQVRELSADFKASLNRVVDHCEQETKAISASWTAEIGRLVEAITTAKGDEADRIVDAVHEAKGGPSRKALQNKHLS